MAAWSDPAALIAVAAAAAVLAAPGLAVGAALRLRGLVLAAAAPLLSVALVAGSAVVAGALGITWGPLPPLAATALAVLAALVLARLTRPPPPAAGRSEVASPRGRVRHRARRPGAGRWAWPLAGAAVGTAVITVQVLRAVATPSTISQAYDVVFHVNAVAWIEATGDASSLHLRRVLGGGADGFYPAAWHDVVSLVAGVSGTGPVVATNATALVVAAALWPLGVVALAHRVLGSRTAAAAAGVLAGALAAMPEVLLDWGVLYPVLLVMALVPCVLVLAVTLLGPRAAQDRPPTAVTLALLVAAGPAVVLAHPSGVFTLAVLTLPLAVWSAVGAARRTWPLPGGRRRVVVGAAAVAALVAAGAVAVTSSTTLAAVAAYQWPTTTRTGDAALTALALAPPDGRAGNVLAAAAAVLGALTVTSAGRARRASAPAADLHPEPGRRGARRSAAVMRAEAARASARHGAGWLVVAWLGAGALYVLAQTTSSQPLTGPWYNDAFRLVPVVAVPALVLAAHGLRVAATAVTTAVGRSPAAGTGRRAAAADARGALVAAAAAVVAVALALAVALAPGSGRERTDAALAAAYRQGPGGDAPLLSRDEQALFARAARIVPPGVVVANDPFDGSGLSYALDGVDPLFRHMGSQWTPAGGIVKDDLARVGDDPAVCRAVREEHVGYLFALGHRYLDFVPRAAYFARVQDAADTDAFEVVAQVGDARLLRLVRCGGEVVPPRG